MDNSNLFSFMFGRTFDHYENDPIIKFYNASREAFNLYAELIDPVYSRVEFSSIMDDYINFVKDFDINHGE